LFGVCLGKIWGASISDINPHHPSCLQIFPFLTSQENQNNLQSKNHIHICIKPNLPSLFRSVQLPLTKHAKCPLLSMLTGKAN
jgi:hypothetical protein